MRETKKEWQKTHLPRSSLGDSHVAAQRSKRIFPRQNISCVTHEVQLSKPAFNTPFGKTLERHLSSSSGCSEQQLRRVAPSFEVM